VDSTDIDWSKFTYLASGSTSGYKAAQITNYYPDPMNPFSSNYYYSFSFNTSGIAGLMTIKIDATDSSGSRQSTVEHQVDDDPDAPAITVDPLQTTDSTPQLSGTLDENPSSVTIRVASQTYSISDLVISGSGSNLTWTLDVQSPIADGTYDVDAEASDALGNTGNDSTTNELTIDATAPTITVDSLTTNDTRPELTGDIDDNSAAITIGVDGEQYSGSDVSISGSSPVWKWTLADNAIWSALSEGTYNVSAQASDALGNTGNDGTTNELTIDTTAPTITVDSLTTTDTRPELTGTVDDNSAAITIGVDGEQYSGSDVSINGSSPVWVWTLADNAIWPALSTGTYDVSAQASDAAGNTGYDGTTDELEITN
jgi:hypothetical protein